MPLIPDTLMSQRVIGLVPVRRDVLPGQENPDGLERIGEMLTLARIPVEQKIRPLINLEFHVPLEHPKRKPGIRSFRLRCDASQRGAADVDGRHWNINEEEQNRESREWTRMEEGESFNRRGRRGEEVWVVGWEERLKRLLDTSGSTKHKAPLPYAYFAVKFLVSFVLSFLSFLVSVAVISLVHEFTTWIRLIFIF